MSFFPYKCTAHGPTTIMKNSECTPRAEREAAPGMWSASAGHEGTIQLKNSTQVTQLTPLPQKFPTCSLPALPRLAMSARPGQVHVSPSPSQATDQHAFGDGEAPELGPRVNYISPSLAAAKSSQFCALSIFECTSHPIEIERIPSIKIAKNHSSPVYLRRFP